MARFRWAALVAVGVVWATSPAAAGPLVAWSFRAEAQPPQSPRVLFAELLRSEGTYQTPSGSIEGVGLIGWTTSSGGPLPGEGGTVQISESFHVTGTVTDVASGQSVDFMMWIMAWSHWDQGADGEWDYIAAGFDYGPRLQFPIDDTEWLTLGRNRYKVWTEEGTLLVEVNAGPSVPEPGTLALAGVGLAGAGLLRFRRRLTAR